ncbi:MAG: SUMF1/EgtB/PvdO family nonheme iron enzyme [Myxococcota bacterium]
MTLVVLRSRVDTASIAALFLLGVACGGETAPPPVSASAEPATVPVEPTSAERTSTERTSGEPRSEEPTGAGSIAEASEEPAEPRDPNAPEDCPPPEAWPEGMACVGGGTFELGDTEGRPDEREPGEVYVDTFYMDIYEVTNEDYEECIVAGVCSRPMPFRRYRAPRQPMVAMSWYDAVAHCERLGKRLPTEAEWERGAAGPDDTIYAWGNEPLGCERAVIQDGSGRGCGTEITAEVGSRPPGHWGLYDMTGNVHEWVADWYSDCLRGCDNECGDACFGRNPQGPCGGGAERCSGHPLKSVRGGSWWWPAERARAQARRGSGAPNRGPHRFGFRCARDLEVEAPAPEAL